MSSLPRIIIEYEGFDAFILPCRGKANIENGKIYMLHSLCDLDPISPNAAQKFIQDWQNDEINFKTLKFKLLDSTGNIHGYMFHDLEQK